ncbi:MAG: hypothetical protein JXB88_10950 [Spirochaetales bacterium]|nr:hypothetical protein [Spirochaetales bacterium]
MNKIFNFIIFFTGFLILMFYGCRLEETQNNIIEEIQETDESYCLNPEATARAQSRGITIYMILYTEKNYKGFSYTIDYYDLDQYPADQPFSIPNFKDFSINDQTSSIKIYGLEYKSAFFFKDPNYDGKGILVFENIPDLEKYKFDNNLSSCYWTSYHLNPFAVLYEHIDYSGQPYVIFSDCNDLNSKYLNGIGINNKTSSLRLLKGLRNLCLYNYTDYEGSYYNFSADISNLKDSPYKFNDKASSAKLCKCNP